MPDLLSIVLDVCPATRDPDAIMLKPDPSRSGSGSGTP